MPRIPMNDWYDEGLFLDEMARAHKLTPKLDVIRSLKEEFDRIKKDQTYKPDLNREDRHWLLVGLSGQVFALSMELTDDLAFVCEAYLKSIANGDRRIVEYVAGFMRRDAVRFYERVTSSGDAAMEAVGLDTRVESKKYMNLFEEIRKLRNHFWKWYNGYKHGKYATPIAVEVGTLREKWGLYLIPSKLRRQNGKVHAMGEERFIDTVTFVEEFVKLAETTVALWTEIRSRQYPSVQESTVIAVYYHETYAVRPRLSPNGICHSGLTLGRDNEGTPWTRDIQPAFCRQCGETIRKRGGWSYWNSNLDDRRGGPGLGESGKITERVA